MLREITSFAMFMAFAFGMHSVKLVESSDASDFNNSLSPDNIVSIDAQILDDTVQQKGANHPPIVKILKPEPDGAYPVDTRIAYEVSVSDQEDGESKYDEINASEVFLEVKYVADTSNARKLLQNEIEDDPVGLAAMKTSNCFNCHGFDEPLIGPSFREISERYTNEDSTVNTLVQRVIEGSSGIWSSTVMPSHPELSSENTKEIIHWILENTSNPNIQYYTGTDGIFQLKLPEGNTTGAFVLTATYTDHGSSDDNLQKLKGQAAILIKADTLP